MAISSEERFRYWGARDPIGTYEDYLIGDGPSLDGRRRTDDAARRAASRRILEEAEARVTSEVEAAEREALESRDSRMPRPESAVGGAYADVGIGERAPYGQQAPPGPARQSV
jgi:hypothetical protein